MVAFSFVAGKCASTRMLNRMHYGDVPSEYSWRVLNDYCGAFVGSLTSEIRHSRTCILYWRRNSPNFIMCRYSTHFVIVPNCLSRRQICCSVCGALRFEIRLCCVVVCRLRPGDGPILLPKNNLNRWLWKRFIDPQNVRARAHEHAHTHTHTHAPTSTYTSTSTSTYNTMYRPQTRRWSLLGNG
jgi:hypothetical protein